MTKVLRCKDVGMDCDFIARADSEEEILRGPLNMLPRHTT